MLNKMNQTAHSAWVGKPVIYAGESNSVVDVEYRLDDLTHRQTLWLEIQLPVDQSQTIWVKASDVTQVADNDVPAAKRPEIAFVHYIDENERNQTKLFNFAKHGERIDFLKVCSGLISDGRTFVVNRNPAHPYIDGVTKIL